MNIRNTLMGVATSTLMCLALTACGSGGPVGAKPSTPEPLAPIDALQKSLTLMHSVTYDVTATVDGVTGTGSIDPANGRAKIAVTTPIGGGEKMTMTNVNAGGKTYLKIDAGSANKPLHLNPAKWSIIDPDKLGDDVALPLDGDDPADPLDLDGLTQAITAAHRTDPTHYAGTIDMTKAGGVLGPDPSELSKAGAKAKSVPFTAVLDEQGRLTSFAIDASGTGKHLSVSVTIMHYGAAKPVAVPTTAAPASASMYSLLKG